MVLLQLIFSIVIMIVLDPYQLYPQLFPLFFCGIYFSSHKHYCVWLDKHCLI